MTTRLEFTVRGTPTPQPRTRARAFKLKGRPGAKAKYVARVYNPDDADGWKERVTLAARAAGLPREPWTDPVRITIDAYFERPQRLLKRASPEGPVRHTAKPDRDNLEKAILDALKRCGLFRDDAQVCDGSVRKWYAAKGHAPGVRIVAELIEDESPQQLELRP